MWEPDLPMVCSEQEILMQYFAEQGENGYDYAYQYPGMNKVLQAAGRVIRTAEDRGVILLLDDRFLRPEIQELFPREWTEYGLVTRETVGGWLKHFWENRQTVEAGENPCPDMEQREVRHEKRRCATASP